MTIWRLPDSRLGSTTAGKTEVPDVAIVHDSLFRRFTLAPGADYPIAFRSDTRDPSQIWDVGFQRRTTVLDKYERVSIKDVDRTTNTTTERVVDRLRDVKAELAAKQDSGKTAEEIENAVRETLRHTLAIRLGNVDLDLECAVCATRTFEIAGLFPYDPKKPELLTQPARIYVVRMRGWLETYKMQQYLAKELAYSMEVACLGIAPEDVLGCVTVARRLEDRTVHLTIQSSVANPNLEPTRFRAVEARLPRSATVPLPQQKNDTSRLTLDEKYDHLVAGLPRLTGKPDAFGRVDPNRVDASGEPAELPAYQPRQATRRVNEF